MRIFTTTIFLLAFQSTLLFAQFNWEHTGGPFGGVFTRIYANDEYAFVSDRYYLYRSADGMNWEQLPVSDVLPLAANGSKLAAKSNGNFVPPSGPIMFIVSEDNGDTWVQRTMPPGYEEFDDIFWCSHGIYIPNPKEDFFYRSTDEGQSWDTIIPPFSFNDFYWKFDDRLYVASSGVFWRTDQSGDNWSSLDIPLDSGEHVRNFWVADQNILVVTNQVLKYSADDGQTWATYALPLPGQSGHLHRAGNSMFFISDENVAVSEDFGANWEIYQLDERLKWSSFFDYAAVNGQLLVTTYDKGVLKWNDGQNTFEVANNGLASGVVYSLYATDERLWAGGGAGLYYYDLAQGSWHPNSVVDFPEKGFWNIYADDDGTLIFSEIFANSFYLSTDFGQSVDTIVPDVGPSNYVMLNPMYVFDKVILLWDYFEDILWRSADMGATWQPVEVPYYLYGQIVKHGNQLLLFVVNKIYASADLGLTWQLYAEIPTANIEALFSAGDRLMMIGSAEVNGVMKSGLFTSVDGMNWTYASDGLPDWALIIDNEYFKFPLFYKYNDAYIMYSGANGFFVSQDTCKTWFPAGYLNRIAVEFSGDEVFAGGFGGGVIRSDIPANFYGELVQGKVFFDENNNGIFDSGEIPVPNVPVALFRAQTGWLWDLYYKLTDSAGNWVLGITPNAQDTLRPLIQSDYLENINPPYYLADTGGSGKDFGIYLTPNVTDLKIDGNSYHRPRPGYKYFLQTWYANAGTLEADATVTLKMDPAITFLDANPAPAAIIGDSLIWDAGAMAVFEKGVITVETKIDTSVALGTPLNSTWRISSTNPDLTPQNNFVILTDTVVGAYDPNEKKVQPAEGLTEAEIGQGKELFFTIYFQNTGTYPAERVRITDMLDTALNLATLRFVGASHTVSSFELKPGRLLEVVFDDIQLPDSLSNEPGSHGYVTFAIQRNKPFNPQVPVRNSAAIYFDFNAPIFTNEVEVGLKDPTVAVREILGSSHNSLLIYPNPSSGYFSVVPQRKLHGSGILSIYTIDGEVIFRNEISDLSQPVFVQRTDIESGVYIVQLAAGEGTMTGKLVVVKEKE